MSELTRRALIGMACAGGTGWTLAQGAAVGAATTVRRTMTGAVAPIGKPERQRRLGKLRALMGERGAAAMLIEAGSTLEYFTGIAWWRSERTTAALIPATGPVVVVTPFFEAPSIRETLAVDADVRTWKEDADPFALLADAIGALPARDAALLVEETTRYFIVDRVQRALRAARRVESGQPLVNACRMIKSADELALMRCANEVTLAALRDTHAQVRAGMSASEIAQLMIEATTGYGGSHEFTLVLVNEASAYPHGSRAPQRVRDGSVILIDTGCSVAGYQSDISRTWVHGSASTHQREVWNAVRRAQQVALDHAHIGQPVGAIDAAVRDFYEAAGWRKDYELPGLPHRTGHGIGMDGHESPYLVRSDATALAAGMCFSDEPGLYLPGSFGVRLEDCWHMTEAGPVLFTPLARSLEEPI